MITLLSSLQELEYDCDHSSNALAPDRVNIILGYNLGKLLDIPKEFKLIIYQLEPLQVEEEKGWYDKYSKHILQQAYDIWDYSLENVAFLKTRGLQAKYLPVGYSPSVGLINQGNLKDKDIDVFFYGALTPRRKQVLQALIDHGITIKAITIDSEYNGGDFGSIRDELIARSKIILNLHRFDNVDLFEQVRVSYLLANRCFVITEKSKNLYQDVFIEAIEYAQLVSKCIWYLENPKTIEQKSLENFEQFRNNYQMTKLLEAVLPSK